MICAGSQTTLVIPVTPSVAGAVDRICTMLAAGSEGVLEISGSSFEARDGTPPEKHIFTENGTGWHYSGPLTVPDTVYIVGGGHVGRALAALLPGLAFRPVIIDSRDSSVLPDSPDCRWIRSAWKSAWEHMEQGSRTWALIMTPEHGADAEVLRSFHGREFRYVGMMASRKKREAIYASLLDEGVPMAFLEDVHCPVGIPIGSRTPAEIAVSIAAELIGIRAGKEL
jgi:xanthine dehydrogenase accessory factor